MFSPMIEEDLNKYRLQRRLIGPAYTAGAIKQMETSMDDLIKSQIGIMTERAGMVVDIESLFHKFITGMCCSFLKAFKTNG